jgi:hypothetical protein
MGAHWTHTAHNSLGACPSKYGTHPSPPLPSLTGKSRRAVATWTLTGCADRPNKFGVRIGQFRNINQLIRIDRDLRMMMSCFATDDCITPFLGSYTLWILRNWTGRHVACECRNWCGSQVRRVRSLRQPIRLTRPKTELARPRLLTRSCRLAIQSTCPTKS